MHYHNFLCNQVETPHISECQSKPWSSGNVGEKSMHEFQGNCIFVGLIDIPALNQQEQDGVRRPVRYGTKKPKKQQQQQQDQEETEQPDGSTEDQGKKNKHLMLIILFCRLLLVW